MSDTRPRNGGTSGVSGIARHGRLKAPGAGSGILSIIGVVLAVVVVASLSVVGIVGFQKAAELKQNSVDINPHGSPAPPPGIGVYPGGFNILIVGDDTRAGQGTIGGGIQADRGALNDVTILLHVSADHTFATAVSFPRDMIIPHAKCSLGGTAAGLPVNTALSYGGLPCVVTEIENFTGVTIQFAGLITFDGVIEMSDAVGGVQVCTTGPLIDNYSGIDLPTAGEHLLQGGQALAFLRSRHGVGDGSDLGRISSQQVYLSALVRKMEAAGTLSDPVTVYKIASAATSSMQLSSSLDSIPTLISIASTLKNIPSSHVVFVQYPGTTGGSGIFSGKVQPTLSSGNALMALIKADKAFTLGAEGDDRGSVVQSKGSTAIKGATVVNGLVGQSAATVTCAKTRPLIDQ
ncbi:MAG TPA: LCP family protein [Galbitalea sp.]|nr:LCP family protein [Galbitalea sp.]